MGQADWALSPPSLDEVAEAANRLEGQIVATPLVENHDLNRMAGGRLLIKAEMLQRTGSFKFRGAYNRIRQLSDDERRRGVIAYSSGNHAQAVACAAGLMETNATIVMPTDAPEMKVERTRMYGAEIVMYDRTLTLGRYAPRPVRSGGPTEAVPAHEFGEPVIRRKRQR